MSSTSNSYLAEGEGSMLYKALTVGLKPWGWAAKIDSLGPLLGSGKRRSSRGRRRLGQEELLICWQSAGRQDVAQNPRQKDTGPNVYSQKRPTTARAGRIMTDQDELPCKDMGPPFGQVIYAKNTGQGLPTLQGAEPW